MNYTDYHANIRRQGEIALERRAHNDFQVRDEPCDLFVASQEHQPDTSSENIIIGGVTHPRWQWQEGIEIFQCPTEDDNAIIQENGLSVSESPIWRIQLDEGNDPNQMIAINGRTMPASYHCGVRSGHPTPEQIAIYNNAGFVISEESSWFICEPKDNRFFE